jgi:hypothetical protein
MMKRLLAARNRGVVFVDCQFWQVFLVLGVVLVLD